MQLGTRLEDNTVQKLRSVASKVGIPVRHGDKWRTKAELIEDMRTKYVRPAVHGSFDEDQVEDIKLALKNKDPQSISRLVKQIPRSVIRSKFYRTDQLRSSTVGGDYEESPYDLREISIASDVEPYIAISIRKHREQILKDGYTIQSKDPSLAKYLRNRLFELSLRSPVTFDDTVREAVTNLIKYHTAHIVIERDITRSTGSPVKLYGNYLEPISSIYAVDPIAMKPRISKKRNKILSWSHVIPGAYDESDNIIAKWRPYDVITITMDRKSGFIFGTPYILPVLDDIRALRRFEELAQIIATKHAFPLMHWKVGTEDQPACTFDDGTSELDLVEAQAEALGNTGSVVTNERSEINLIGAEGEALDLKDYLKYFEQRALGGLRLSEIDLGRGSTANKSTAGSMSKSIEDASRDYQRAFSQAVSWSLLMYLSMEGGFDVNEESMAQMVFPPINQEEERARQNHAIGLFQSDAITCQELRQEGLGKEPFSQEQEKDTFTQRVALPQFEKQEKVKAEIKQKNQPANQSGRKATKTRVTANNSFNGKTRVIVDKLIPVIANMPEDISVWDKLINTVANELINEVSAKVIMSAKKGSMDASIQLDREEPYFPHKQISYLKTIFVSKVLTDSVLRCLMQVRTYLYSETKDTSSAISSLRNMRYTLEDVFNKIVKVSYRYGFVRAAKFYGQGDVKFISDDREIIIDFAAKNIPIKLLMPSGYDEDCRLEIHQEGPEND